MYRELTRTLAIAMILIGAAMIFVTARGGGGIGYLLGSLFVFAGVGRLYLVMRRG
jgi:hypothetical protein